METLTIDHNNGHKTEYNLLQDDSYDLPIAYYKHIPQKLVEALEYARKNNLRIKLDLGDTKTGKSWNEVYDVTGRIGLSRGDKARFPILVHNTRSLGGTSILQDCILSIHLSANPKSNYTSRCLYSCLD